MSPNASHSIIYALKYFSPFGGLLADREESEQLMWFYFNLISEIDEGVADCH
jgi:hypothetical protein